MPKVKEDNYSNREIEHFFEEIRSSLERIEAQVMKTNGRVTALEMWKETFMAKITVLMSAVGVVWVLIKQFILK